MDFLSGVIQTIGLMNAPGRGKRKRVAEKAKADEKEKAAKERTIGTEDNKTKTNRSRKKEETVITTVEIIMITKAVEIAIIVRG